MSKFAGRWFKTPKRPLAEKFRDAVKPRAPLRYKLEQAVRQLKAQVAQLEAGSRKLSERDTALFRKIVAAVQNHEMYNAPILANELVEVRKMNKLVTQSKLALEQIILRFDTIRELGDIVVTLTPAMSVISNLRTDLVKVMPETEMAMSQIGELLTGIIADSRQSVTPTAVTTSVSEEAEKILSQASSVAEQRMKERFPELPKISVPEPPEAERLEG